MKPIPNILEEKRYAFTSLDYVYDNILRLHYEYGIFVHRLALDCYYDHCYHRCYHGDYSCYYHIIINIVIMIIL